MGQAFGIALVLFGAVLFHIAVGRSKTSNPLTTVLKDFADTASQLTGNPAATTGPSIGGDNGSGTVILA